MQYELSTEVEKVANSLIKQFHDELKSKTIVYVTQEKKDDKTGQSVAQMRKGRPVLADVKVIGGLNAFLVSGETATGLNGPTPFAVVVVSKHAWNLLKAKQREAMLDEQLCRLDYDTETGKPTVSDYDVHAITLNAKRFGAWNEDLDRFLTAAQDFPLFKDLDEGVTDPKPKVKKAAAGATFEGNGAREDPPVSKVESIKAKKRGRPAQVR